VLVQLGWFIAVELPEWRWKAYSPETLPTVFIGIEEAVVVLSIILCLAMYAKESDKNKF